MIQQLEGFESMSMWKVSYYKRENGGIKTALFESKIEAEEFAKLIGANVNPWKWKVLCEE